MQGELGSLIERATMLQAATQVGLHVGLSDITVEEFAAVCILQEERLKFEAEELRRRDGFQTAR